jgi:hypothetical protein
MRKSTILALALALLLVGCISTSLDNYQYSTLAQVNAKVRANNSNENDMYNHWFYAGSDDHFDYIYEFKRGISVTPNSNFHYYKLDKGQFNPVGGRYPFSPDPNRNAEIDTW